MTRFLVNAQLPRRLAAWLADQGCDALHTLDMPRRNRTPDSEVIDIADREARAVVTEDEDFVDSHTPHRRPAKLVLVSTGNLSNCELEALIVPLIPSIIANLETCDILEVGKTGIVIRG